MDKQSFYEILKSSTPEELNTFISNKGKRKMVNGVTFIKDSNTDTNKDNSKEEMEK